MVRTATCFALPTADCSGPGLPHCFNHPALPTAMVYLVSLTAWHCLTHQYTECSKGPFWYASGATVQILLFATLAIELKRKAPNAHTFLEVVRARYGVYTHAVYIVFGLMTNILVTAMLLTGGSAVVTSLTGMPTAAACFLLPVGVVLYTLFGGIKATFLTDYVHTVSPLFLSAIHESSRSSEPP